MPISAKAYAGLKAAAKWNPTAAQFLFYLLKVTPQLVKYKDDPYGPLALILIQDVVRKPLFQSLSVPIKRLAFPHLDEIGTYVKLPPFPQENLADCKVFGDEWKQRRFSKKEFADALEKVLSDLR
ncbi:MAG: hypothetical protein ACXW4Q_15420 [Anaerolineales bacterium]